MVGIDGVPYEMIKELSDKGIMKNFSKLREEGSFLKMKSSVPAVSSASWSTIITGKNPGEHGVYGFTDFIKGSYTTRFCDFRRLKSPAFWHRNRGKFVILNVPSTYPARKLNGCHVSGFVSPYLDKAVYPSKHLKKLKEMDYRIDIDSEKAHKSKTLLFKELFDSLDARIRASRYFWKEYNWDLFKIVFTGTDRLEHFLWDAYEDEKNEHHEKFLEFFRRIDAAIGEMAGKLGSEDTLIMLSDHGMERLEYNVNPNAVLIENGFLKLGSEPRKKYNNVLSGTKAFALEFGSVYLNDRRFPRGSVENSEEALEEITAVFENLEINGRKVIGKVFRKEDVYRGDLESAPDLVLIPNKGFNLRGKLTGKVFEESPLTGMHNGEAFLFVKNGKTVREPSVEDVVPIIDEVMT